MYNIFMSIHNILRWLVVFAAVLALARMFVGWLGRKDWSKRDDMLSGIFTGLLDLQLLVGLVIYFLVSPITQAALVNFSASLNASDGRFFILDHPIMMLVGVVLAHVGRALSRKATGLGKFRQAAIWFSLAVLVILVSVPWPFSIISRPWLRLGPFLLN